MDASNRTFHVYGKTAAGQGALSLPRSELSAPSRQLLILVDGRRTLDELSRFFNAEALERSLQELVDKGCIELLRHFPDTNAIDGSLTTSIPRTLAPDEPLQVTTMLDGDSGGSLGDAGMETGIKAFPVVPALGALLLAVGVAVYFLTRPPAPNIPAVPVASTAPVEAPSPSPPVEPPAAVPAAPARVAASKPPPLPAAPPTAAVAPAPEVASPRKPPVLAHAPAQARPVAPVDASGTVRFVTVPPQPPGSTTPPVAPNLLHIRTQVAPSLPQKARELGITTGKVVVVLHVDPAGAVQSVELVEATPPQVYDADMEKTFRQWTFDPLGIPGRMTIEINVKPPAAVIHPAPAAPAAAPATPATESN